jgi:PIN domain nuclease of toxin-antitoxin system
VILLDTLAIVFDPVAPERLTRRAAAAIARAASQGLLACSDISLWEIAMLAARGRLELGVDPAVFMDKAIQARSLSVLPIVPQIAVLAQPGMFAHGDPADRIIAATALHHRARLVTADERLHGLKGLTVVW